MIDRRDFVFGSLAAAAAAACGSSKTPSGDPEPKPAEPAKMTKKTILVLARQDGEARYTA